MSAAGSFRLSVAVAVVVGAILVAGAASAQQTSDLFTGFQTGSNDPVEINATSLEIVEDGEQRISEFAGNVVVRRGDTVMHASSIKVYSDIGENRPRGQAFSRIEASGNVEVRSGPQRATGTRVVVDMGKQTITMSGGVVLSQGANVITGDRLVVDLASGRARVEQAAGQQIRGVFTPGGSGGLPGQ